MDFRTNLTSLLFTSHFTSDQLKNCHLLMSFWSTTLGYDMHLLRLNYSLTSCDQRVGTRITAAWLVMGLAADGCSVSGEAIHFIPSPECRLRGLTTQRVGKENERKGKQKERKVQASLSVATKLINLQVHLRFCRLPCPLWRPPTCKLESQSSTSSISECICAWCPNQWWPMRPLLTYLPNKPVFSNPGGERVTARVWSASINESAAAGIHCHKAFWLALRCQMHSTLLHLSFELCVWQSSF